MRNRIIIVLAIIGALGGLISAYILGIQKPAQSPVFKPVSSPYESAIYANGMIESTQESGENISIYPEVSGVVTQILVHEGQAVKAGTALLQIDDTVQRATAEQLKNQAEAAKSLWQELVAEPRKENLEIAGAQVDQAGASLKVLSDQYDKRRQSYELDPRSISKDTLDSARDAVDQARAGLILAQKQYDLTRAGAWSYDIENQKKLYLAAQGGYNAALALLGKFTVRAQVAGVVLAVNGARGGYVSPLGAYDAYTQGTDPLITMSSEQDYLSVRCFVDEILVAKLPDAAHMRAEMSVRGTTLKIPLEFVRVQPLVSPKLELSNQRQEKVDLRVLPVLFKFSKKNLTSVYPGQQVDVYIGRK